MTETVKVFSGSSKGKSKRPYDAMVYIDGTSVIAIDSEGNVIKRGVAGTDDASVIQAMIDSLSGGVVKISRGDYVLNTHIYTKSNLLFCGSGNSTTFESSDSSVKYIYVKNVSNVILRDYLQKTLVVTMIYSDSDDTYNVSIIGVTANLTKYTPFRIQNTSLSYKIYNITFEGCIALDTAWGFNTNASIINAPVEDLTFLNCAAINCGKSSVARVGRYDVGFSLELASTKNVRYINCVARGCLESGFHQETTPVRDNVLYLGCTSADNGQKTKLSNTIVDGDSLTQATPFVCNIIGNPQAGNFQIRCRLISSTDSITAFSVRIQGLTPGDVPIDETITEATPGVVNETNGWSFYTTNEFKTDSTPTITVNSVTGSSYGDYINAGQDCVYGYGFMAKDSSCIGCTTKDEIKGFYCGSGGDIIECKDYDSLLPLYGIDGDVRTLEMIASGTSFSNFGKYDPIALNARFAILDLLGDVRFLADGPLVAGTSVRDRSRKVNNLTASSTVSSWYWFVGRSTCLNFNGSSHYLYRANDTDFDFGDGAGNDTAFSIVCCINPDNVTSRFIIGKWDVNNQREWRLFFDASGYPTLQLYDESADKYIGRQDQTAFTTGSWKVLITTYSASETSAGIKIYINGVQVDDANYEDAGYNSMDPVTANLMVGALKNAAAYSEYFDGKLTWIGVAAKELSADEVWSLTQRLKGVLGI